jgi:hypothetical protein
VKQLSFRLRAFRLTKKARLDKEFNKDKADVGNNTASESKMDITAGYSKHHLYV